MEAEGNRGQRTRKEDMERKFSKESGRRTACEVSTRRKEGVSSPALSTVTEGMSTKTETFDYQHASSGVITLLPEACCVICCDCPSLQQRTGTVVSSRFPDVWLASGERVFCIDLRKHEGRVAEGGFCGTNTRRELISARQTSPKRSDKDLNRRLR